MLAIQRTLRVVFLALPAVACTTGAGPADTSTGMTRAERNLCEQMRSFEPYRPGECRKK